jgi:hypothetical protein
MFDADAFERESLFWDERDYVNGVCPYCGGPLDDSYDCPICEPRVALEDSPVRASFEIKPDGAVVWAAGSAP